MNEIEKALKLIKEIYDSSSDEVKKSIRIHIQFISEKEENITKPTLDDYTTIRSYEDACEALGEPVFEEPEDMPKHIVAMMKLETISRALWGRTWMPEPDADGSKWFYHPVFALYTKSEIENMDEYKRGGLLSANAGANVGAGAGFGFLYAIGRPSNASAHTGFRLCQETREKTLYFGKQFLELWAEYLKFGFEVGERLK